MAEDAGVIVVARELKFAIAEAEQQAAQGRLPSLEERNTLYIRRAKRIIEAAQGAFA